MQLEPDALARYAATGSHAAFREVVQAAMPMVMGTAMRRTGGQRAMAEDIAQLVFIDLARQAKSVRADTLSGWLYRHTCFTAAKIMRGERRRVQRERVSAESRSSSGDTGTEDIDDLLLGMEEADRQALLLRYVDGRSHDEVAAALGITRAAAQKRTERALARLRELHRADLPAAGLACLIAPPLADPTGLVDRLSAGALAKRAATMAGVAKPIAGALWGAAAAVTLAALPLAWLLREHATAKLAATSGMVAVPDQPRAVPWAVVDHAGIPRPPVITSADDAVRRLLEIANRDGVGNAGQARATAMILTIPEKWIHGVLVGLGLKTPPMVRGTAWYAGVCQVLAGRWQPRRIPEDLIAVWQVLPEAAYHKAPLFKACAAADLAATRKLLDGFADDPRIYQPETLRENYLSSFREEVMSQLLEDSPADALAFFATLPTINAWDGNYIGETALAKAAKDPATRQILWKSMESIKNPHRFRVLCTLARAMPTAALRTAIEGITDPTARAEAATYAAALEQNLPSDWWKAQVPENLRPQMTAELRRFSSYDTAQKEANTLMLAYDDSHGGPDFDEWRVMLVRNNRWYVNNEKKKLAPDALADIAHRITDPAKRAACLGEVLAAMPSRDDWMANNLTPGEIEQFNVIFRINNHVLPE